MSPMRPATRRIWRVKTALLAALAVLLVAPILARGAVTQPDGLSAIALSGKVSLAWQPVGGATSYRIYRGTSAGSINTQVGTSVTPSFADTTVTNGTAYYYVVRGDDGSQGPASDAVQATPRAASCSTGNEIVRENCFPGSTSFPLQNPTRAYSGGIEGYASQTSVNQGSSIALKVNTGDGVPYHVEIYRAGWYGGSRARLVSVLPGRTGVAQPNCEDGDGNTGLLDCSNWSTTDTITTTQDWPTGVYWLRLVREDNNTDNAIILVVRHDGDNGDLLYQLPTNTYQAYNNYGGKSLYTFNSSGYTTLAGTPRAVKVSFDRPYQQTITGQNNWFPEADQGNIAWLERQGYSVDYITSTDLQTGGGQLASHPVFVSGAHDEYWSQQMRDAVTAARDSGHSIFWLGSNQVYWKTRSEASPFSGQNDRVEVCYKTTESGPPDPSGQPTGTWRDPAGANAPENALVGSQYVGDNDFNDFPMVVTAAEGKQRSWRHTSLASLAPNTSQTFGTNLVGWEWNDRAANGQEPAGVQSIFSAPTNGNILQDAGRVYAQGSATGTGTYYKAASGAVVFSTSTNNWSLGLALNGFGQGEPNTFIKQATARLQRRRNRQHGTSHLRPLDRPLHAHLLHLQADARRQRGAREHRVGRLHEHRDPHAVRATRPVGHLPGPGHHRRGELGGQRPPVELDLDVRDRDGRGAAGDLDGAERRRRRRPRRLQRDRDVQPLDRSFDAHGLDVQPDRPRRRLGPGDPLLRRLHAHGGAGPERAARPRDAVHGDDHDRRPGARRHRPLGARHMELHHRRGRPDHRSLPRPAGEQRLAVELGAGHVLQGARPDDGQHDQLLAERTERRRRRERQLRRGYQGGDPDTDEHARAGHDLHGARHARRARCRRISARGRFRLELHDEPHGSHGADPGEQQPGPGGDRHRPRHRRDRHVRPRARPGQRELLHVRPA